MKTSETHYMNLNDAPFRAIRSGNKSIEMRLCDEKRRIIKVGDTIVFTNNQTRETIETLVISLSRYESFEELYKHHDKVSIGYSPNEDASPNDMLLYYSAEQIKKHGTLAIEVNLI